VRVHPHILPHSPECQVRLETPRLAVPPVLATDRPEHPVDLRPRDPHTRGEGAFLNHWTGGPGWDELDTALVLHR